MSDHQARRSRPHRTATEHDLQFSQLSPMQFERFCGELLRRLGHRNIRFWGQSGSDGGCDISSTDKKGRAWASQVKRVSRPLSKTQAGAELVKVLKRPPIPQPQVFLLATSANINRGNQEELENMIAQHGKNWSIKCWGGPELDGMARDFPELLERFFAPLISGPGEPAPPRRQRFTQQEIRRFRQAMHGALLLPPTVRWGHRRWSQSTPLAELFIPIKLEHRSRKSPAREHLSAEDLVNHLQPGTATWHRLAILGDAGSGKTTLLRYLASKVAEKEAPGQLGTLAPLYLRLRDLRLHRTEHGQTPLLTFITNQASRLFQTNIDSEDLENLLTDGQLMLFLDGYDEVGEFNELEDFRDQLLALCSAFAKAPVWLTSRPGAFGQTPFPDDTNGAFLTLALEPFDSQMIEELAQKMLATQAPLANAPKVDYSHFTSSLKSKRNIESLAKTPLLAVLLILIYRDTGRIPANRASLFEELLRLVLRDWPASTGRKTILIPLEQQLCCLADVSSKIQLKEDDGHGIFVPRRAFAEYLEKQPFSILAGDVESELILDQWLDFLENEAGLLIWSGYEIYEFAHRSVFDYLAARGIAQTREAATTVAEGHARKSWHEVCFLIVSIRSKDRSFLGKIFQLLEDKHTGLNFLRHCLIEDAAFDDEQLHEILKASARETLTAWTPVEMHGDDQSYIRRIFDEILAFSADNAGRVERWVDEQVRTSSDDDLRSLIAVFFEQPQRVIESLDKREDAAKIAPQLLEFWPGTEFGRWAAVNLSGANIETTSSYIDGSDAIPLSIVALSEEPQLCKTLLLALVTSASWVSAIGREFNREQSTAAGNESDPQQLIQIYPLEIVLRLETSWPHKNAKKPNDYHYLGPPMDVMNKTFRNNVLASRNNYTSRLIASAIAKEDLETGDLLEHFVDYFISQDFLFSLNSTLHFQLAKLDLADSLSDEDKYLMPEVFQSYVRSLLTLFLGSRSGHSLWPRFDSLAPQVSRKTHRHRLTSRPSEEPKRTSAWLRNLRSPLKPKKFWTQGFPQFVRLGAEGWCGVFSTVEETPFKERLAIVHRRVQNAWLHLMWPALEDCFAADLNNDQQALYLALGWSQATTTGEWPQSKRWESLINFRKPEHWLPRSQWHLVQMLRDLSNEDKLQEFRMSLLEGKAGPDQDLARALLRIFDLN